MSCSGKIVPITSTGLGERRAIKIGRLIILQQQFAEAFLFCWMQLCPVRILGAQLQSHDVLADTLKLCMQCEWTFWSQIRFIFNEDFLLIIKLLRI